LSFHGTPKRSTTNDADIGVDDFVFMRLGDRRHRRVLHPQHGPDCSAKVLGIEAESLFALAVEVDVE
jgi:hypothetical protein